MRHILTVLLVAAAGALPLLVCDLSAATAPGACNVKQARKDVTQAKRQVAKAKQRLTEAKRVLAETQRNKARYGIKTARWVRLARRKGFAWRQMPTVMCVIHAESRGDPAACNSSTGAVGLWQFMPEWWRGKWDPYHPPTAMAKARKAVSDQGWGPWGR